MASSGRQSTVSSGRHGDVKTSSGSSQSNRVKAFLDTVQERDASRWGLAFHIRLNQKADGSNPSPMGNLQGLCSVLCSEISWLSATWQPLPWLLLWPLHFLTGWLLWHFQLFYAISSPISRSLWRNWLARSAVNRKVGGSSPPRDDLFLSSLSYDLHNHPLTLFNEQGTILRHTLVGAWKWLYEWPQTSVWTPPPLQESMRSHLDTTDVHSSPLSSLPIYVPPYVSPSLPPSLPLFKSADTLVSVLSDICDPG